MPTTFTHLGEGHFEMRTSDDNPLKADGEHAEAANADGQRQGEVPPAPVGAPVNLGPTDIFVTPVNPFPYPMGIIVNHEGGGAHGGGRRGPVLDLVNELKDGAFPDSTVSYLRPYLKNLPTGVPLVVDAYIPPGHSIDIGRLSNHVGSIAHRLGQPVQFRMGLSTLKG